MKAPGASDEREMLARLRSRNVTAVAPKPTSAPVSACAVWDTKLNSCDIRIASPDIGDAIHTLPHSINNTGRFHVTQKGLTSSRNRLINTAASMEPLHIVQ